MTKIHKITLYIVDHDDIGGDLAADTLENTHYPNRCISPHVMSVETAEVAWSDDHPINKLDKAISLPAVQELFPKPVVTVGYALGDDADEPTVTVDPTAAVTVKLVDVGAEARHIVTRKGVSIYQCDRDCTLSDYWMSTTPYTSSEADDAFDIRDLDITLLTREQLAQYAEELGDPGAYEDMIVLAYYIDQGYITEDGLHLS